MSTNSDKLSRELDVAAKQLVDGVLVDVVDPGESDDELGFDVDTGVDGVLVVVAVLTFAD